MLPFSFPRIIDCQAARMNGIKCGFLDRALSLLCSNDELGLCVGPTLTQRGLPNVCDLTAALIQDRVTVCLIGDLQLVLGSHPQKSWSE